MRVRRWIAAGVLTLGLGGTASIPTIATDVAPAFAVDQPLASAWLPDQATGCQMWVAGRNVPVSAHQPGPNTPMQTYSGPSFAVRWAQFGSGNNCSFVRFNFVITCPSLFLTTWVLSEPAYWRDPTIDGIQWLIPPIIAYPTCQFVGWWVEMRGGQSVCHAYSATVVQGVQGAVCHPYPTSSQDPRIWPWQNNLVGNG